MHLTWSRVLIGVGSELNWKDFLLQPRSMTSFIRLLKRAHKNRFRFPVCLYTSQNFLTQHGPAYIYFLKWKTCNSVLKCSIEKEFKDVLTKGFLIGTNLLLEKIVSIEHWCAQVKLPGGLGGLTIKFWFLKKYILLI